MAARVTTRSEHKAGGILLALPALLWLGLFFLLPLIIVLIISLMSRGSGGSAVLPFTFDQYTRVFDTFWIVLQRSILVALLTTQSASSRAIPSLTSSRVARPLSGGSSRCFSSFCLSGRTS